MALDAPTTAEQVLAVVEAVVAANRAVPASFVAEFLDITTQQAEAALSVAHEALLIQKHANDFSVANPLCRYTVAPAQKAAVLRLALEGYAPFTIFRERLLVTTDVARAARETKVICQLGAHRDEVRDTLISLGTYSNALVTQGGGAYQLDVRSLENSLQTISLACRDAAAAEGRIRDQLGPAAQGTVNREQVILPLADALLRARQRDARGAVVTAGNAVESFLAELAGRMGVGLAGANGINAKLDRFVPAGAAPRLPRKIVAVGKYLGNIRNAADHGVDPEVGAAWEIRDATGIEYPFVACSFIASCIAVEQHMQPEI